MKCKFAAYSLLACLLGFHFDSGNEGNLFEIDGW
jgi:hypothetical protein